MSRTLRVVAALVLVTAGLVWLPRISAQAGGQPSTKNGEWPHYAADLKGSRYSPLDQINAANFNKLEVAWRFKTDNLGPLPEFKLEGTPIVVKGVLYTTGGTRRAVDGARCQNRRVDLGRIACAKASARRCLRVSSRVAACRTGPTAGRRAHRLRDDRLSPRRAQREDRRAGHSFGENGIVDLKVGVVKGRAEPIDLETGEIGVHSTPIVVKDMHHHRILDARGRDRPDARQHQGARAGVRCQDRQETVAIRHDSTAWRVRQRDVGRRVMGDQWQRRRLDANHASTRTSGSCICPVETPTSDYYGGHRPGNNLFAESLVCVDLKTGQRKWHFQFVHHPLWNFDMSSAPLLGDVTIDGRVAQGGGGPDQAGLALRVRSRDGRADLADRGKAGAERRRSRRVVFADTAPSDATSCATRATSSTSPTT